MFKTKDSYLIFFIRFIYTCLKTIVIFYHYSIFHFTGFKRMSVQEREMRWSWPNDHVKYVVLYFLGKLQIAISN